MEDGSHRKALVLGLVFGLVTGALAITPLAMRLRLRAPPPAWTFPMVIAKHDLRAGATLTLADLDVVYVPEQFLTEHSYSNPSDAFGQVLLYDVAKGDLVRTPMTASLPAEFRAVCGEPRGDGGTP